MAPQDKQDKQDSQGNQQYQRPVQTLACAFAAIAAQTEPWVAINEFLHEWFDYSRTERDKLVADDILPGGPSSLLEASPTPEQTYLWRWAVFCAAAADYLCARYAVTPPAWMSDPQYTLAEPWYNFGASIPLTPEAKAHLEQTTPDQLRRRNIMGGAYVFTNKYEFVDQVRRLVASRDTPST